jgi:hypothetical protein
MTSEPIPYRGGPLGLHHRVALAEIELQIHQPADGVFEVQQRLDGAGCVPLLFLVAHAQYATRGWREAADVLLHEPAAVSSDAGGAGGRLLAQLPGCVLVTVHTPGGRCEFHTRSGPAHVMVTPPDVPEVGLRCAVLGGYWLLAGEPLGSIVPEHVAQIRMVPRGPAVRTVAGRRDAGIPEPRAERGSPPSGGAPTRDTGSPPPPAAGEPS